MAVRAAGEGKEAAFRASRTLVGAWSDAYLAALALVVAECVVVAIRAHGELGGLWEFARVVVGLLPVAAAAAGLAAIGGAALLWGVGQAERRAGRWLVGALSAGLGAFAAVGVSGGRMLAGTVRPWFIGAVTLAALAVGVVGARPTRRLLQAAARRGLAVRAALCTGLVASLALLNTLILVRLYPAFHLALALLTIWTAALVFVAPATRRPAGEGRGGTTGPLRLLGQWRRVVALVLFAAAAACAPWAARQLGGYDNIRFIYLERAPTLSHAVRLASWLSPPLPLDDPLGQPVERRSTRSVDLHGRDVLLVTIDALRADHVGAYGYSRPTTPAMDQLAQQGVLFEHAYTPTPHTSYAVSSLMTGRYLRSLMRQGLRVESETWALLMRRYGYRTAAFFPPAVFFIDRSEFAHLADSGLGFEYRKVEFASASMRIGQLTDYLSAQPDDRRLFVWVHLYEPHEPYELHPEFDYGARDVDRYDSEIAAADAAVGELVQTLRQTRPHALVIVSADHGEEFGDHGGRYHGTTVYEEQVRVPLIFHAPGLLEPRRVSEPVSLVDLMPTVLSGAGMPLSPRLHGRDLGDLLLGGEEGPGFAFAETDEQTLLAVGTRRLVCARKVGACRLFQLSDDPAQTRDRAAAEPAEAAGMKRRLGSFVAGLGRYGDAAGTAPDKGWPPALRRGIAGDGEAAVEVASLLDDADVAVRRRAAEVLFELRREEAAPQLRRTLGREEDETVRRWCALALTRLGQGAPLTYDLLTSKETSWRRLAALALAESGDDRGERELLDWWRQARGESEGPAGSGSQLPFARAVEIIAALAEIRSEAAVRPLTKALADVRLRRYLAPALASIGEPAARPALARAFAEERYHDARVALAEALVSLGASGELRKPLVRFLGVPDPLPQGLALASRAELLPFIGGPRKREVERLHEYARSGVVIGLVVPEGGNGSGYRVLVRGRSTDAQPGQVRFGLLSGPPPPGKDTKALVPSAVPKLDPRLTVALPMRPAEQPDEVYGPLPAAAAEQIEPGEHQHFVVYSTQNVELSTCAVVPLADELPPPAPEPWSPEPD